MTSGAGTGATHAIAAPGNAAVLRRRHSRALAPRPTLVNALQATRTPSPERRIGSDALAGSPLLQRQSPGAAAGAPMQQLSSAPHPQPGPHLLNPGLARPSRPSFLDADMPPAPASSLLNNCIKATTSWQGLAHVVHQHGQHFNFIHVSAAVTHLAQLLDDPRLPPSLRPSLLAMQSAAVAAAAGAAAAGLPMPGAATAGAPPRPAALPHLQDPQSPSSRPRAAPPATADHEDYSLLMDSLLMMVHCRMHQFGARQAANTLWALSVLQPTHAACLPLMERLLAFTRALLPWCEPQHLSNAALAAARAQLYLEDEWVETYLSCVEAALPRFEPQHLANTAWALASLGIAPDAAWVGSFLARVQSALPHLAPVDVSQILYSLACLGVRPEGAAQAALLSCLYQRLLQKSSATAMGTATAPGAAQQPTTQGSSSSSSSSSSGGNSSPTLVPAGPAGGAMTASTVQLGLKPGTAASVQSISNSLWALATMGVVPSRTWLDEVFAEVEARLPEFQPQEVSNLLWAAATLSITPPASLLQRLYDVTEPLLHTFSTQALSNTIWALASFQPDAGHRPSSSSSSSLSTPPPSKRWTAAFLEAFEVTLPVMSDQHVANTIWGLARLRASPRPELAAAVVQHLYRLDCAATTGATAAATVEEGAEGAGVSGQALANSLGALAGLGFKLGGPAAELVAEMVQRRLSSELGDYARARASATRGAGRRRAGGAKRGALGSASAPSRPGAVDEDAFSDAADVAGASSSSGGTGRARLRGMELAQLTFALGKLGAQLPRRTAAALLEALHRRLPTAAPAPALPPATATMTANQPTSSATPRAHPDTLSRPEDLSQVLWGLASLGLNPDGAWLASFWSACCLVLPRMDALDLGQLVYAMAKLGWNPQAGQASAGATGLSTGTTQAFAGATEAAAGTVGQGVGAGAQAVEAMAGERFGDVRRALRMQALKLKLSTGRKMSRGASVSSQQGVAAAAAAAGATAGVAGVAGVADKAVGQGMRVGGGRRPFLRHAAEADPQGYARRYGARLARYGAWLSWQDGALRAQQQQQQVLDAQSRGRGQAQAQEDGNGQAGGQLAALQGALAVRRLAARKAALKRHLRSAAQAQPSFPTAASSDQAGLGLGLGLDVPLASSAAGAVIAPATVPATAPATVPATATATAPVGAHAGAAMDSTGASAPAAAPSTRTAPAPASPAPSSSSPLLARPTYTPPPSTSASSASSPAAPSRSTTTTSSSSPSPSPSASPSGPGIGLLLFRVAATLPAVPSYSFATLSWGLAQMGVTPGTAWCEVVLAEQLRRRCSTLEPSHLATALWALAKLGARPAPKSLLLVESALFKRLPSLRPRELAACAWAFATMRYTPDVDWLDAFAQQCMSLVAEFSLQDWVVMVRSLSTIAEQEQDAVIYLEDLFISPQLEAQVHKFPPSALATFIHSCGVLGARSGRLLGRLLAAARRHMTSFSGQELTAIACTLARLRCTPDPAFITAWLSAYAARIPECRGPALAAAAWALATLGVKPHKRWQTLFAAVVAERLDSLAPKHASMLVWAFGQWGSALNPQLLKGLTAMLGRTQMGFGSSTARRGARWAMARIRRRGKVEESRRRMQQERREKALAKAQGQAQGQQRAVAVAAGSGR